MTPLGLNTAAAPEAAALFPFSAAVPPAAEGADAGSTAFGDLLAASFAQSEQPQTAVANPLGSPVTLSLADVWFAGLNVDLNALNASLETEEVGTPAVATAAAEVPAKDTAASDAVDDEDAALMAMSMAIPNAWPEGHALQVLDDATACSAHPSGCAEDGSSQLAALSPQANAMDAIAPAIAPEERVDGQTPAVIDRQAPREAADVAPQADLVRAASINVKVPTAKAPAASVVEVAAKNIPAASPASVETAPAVAHAAPAAPAEANKGLEPQANIVGVTATPQQATPVEEPKAVLGKVIEVAPAVQQTGRNRESLAVKLAEMTGPGPSVGAAPKPAPGTNMDSDSQSPSQDGSPQDAFATGTSANVAAARSADSAAVMPVFTVAPSIDGGARAVPVEGVALPPAPPAATVPGPENVGRLVESMHVQVRNGIQEATVRLNPDHLGEVTISVRVERGAVSAVVHAETPAVQHWLESQEEKLRSGLSEQGLHLERFIVQRDGSRRDPEQQRQQQPAPRYKQPRDNSAIRFEVLV